MSRLFRFPQGGPAVFLGLFLAVFLAYLPSLPSRFIMDDKYLVEQNDFIKDARLWPRIFTTDIFHFCTKDAGSAMYYRPLQSLSYAFEYGMWKDNPAGYRFTNIVIHSLNAFLFFLLSALLFREKKLALLSAFIFSLLPIHPCLVTFVAGRSDLLQTFFLLLSLFLFCRFHLRGGTEWRQYLCSLASFVLALLTREGALLLPLFLALCAGFMDNKKKALVRIIPYAGIAAGYLLLRQVLMPCPALLIGGGLLHKAAEYLRLSFVYFRQLIFPVDFQLFFNNNGLGTVFMILSAGLAVIFAAGAFSPGSPGIFGWLFFFTGLLPLANLLEGRQFFGTVLTEHYAYISSMGYAFLLALSLLKAVRAWKAAGIVLLSAVLLASAGLTVVNSANYRDNRSFYAYVLRHDPDNQLARSNLAECRLAEGDLGGAQALAAGVLDHDPGNWSMHLLLGTIAGLRSEPEKAQEHFKTALRYNPRSSEAAYSLGLLYERQHRDEEALESFREAFRIGPDSAQGLRVFGEFLLKKGLIPEAVGVCRKLSALEPRSASAQVLLGSACAMQGRKDEAQAHFRRALRLDARNADARRNLGSLYANSGDLANALAQWRAALEINPHDPQTLLFIEKAEKLRERQGAGPGQEQ